MEKKLRNVKVNDLQADEIWAYVGMKEKTKKRKALETDTLGDAYTFVAFERNSKLIVEECRRLIETEARATNGIVGVITLSHIEAGLNKGRPLPGNGPILLVPVTACTANRPQMCQQPVSRFHHDPSISPRPRRDTPPRILSP